MEEDVAADPKEIMKISLPTVLKIFASVLFAFPGSAQTELIVNGGFESSSGGWTLSGSPSAAEITSSGGAAKTGTNYLSLGGAINASQAASQTVTLPANVSAATLAFSYNITSLDGSAVIHDAFSATIRDPGGTVLATVGSWSNTNQDAGSGNPYYHQASFDLLPFAGQTILLHFSCTNDANLGSDFRVDDVSLLVTQTNCWYALNPSNALLGDPPYGVTNSFTVNVANGCLWGATTTHSWIHTSSRGMGSGIVNYSVDWNTNYSARSGTITVGGQAFTIFQAGNDCTLSLFPSASNHSAAAESGAFGVSGGITCIWCAYASHTWLHTTSCGKGNGIINYTVDANSSTNQRAGTISVLAWTFTVWQPGARPAPPLAFSQQGINLTLSWPTNDPAFRLEFATNLLAANWIPLSDAPSLLGGRYTIAEGMTNEARFFRLKK